MNWAVATCSVGHQEWETVIAPQHHEIDCIECRGAQAMMKITLARIVVAVLIVLVLGAASMIIITSNTAAAPTAEMPGGFLH
jgi:hypothetical protein